MNQFETQISKPEKAPAVNATLEVNEETTKDQQIATCQGIVQAKLEEVLDITLNIIERRIENLSLFDQVNQQTYTHEIEAFKAALRKLYQEVQFLTYDVTYGLNNKEDRVAVPIEFKGEAIGRLAILEAVTLIILPNSKSSIN